MTDFKDHPCGQLHGSEPVLALHSAAADKPSEASFAVCSSLEPGEVEGKQTMWLAQHGIRAVLFDIFGKYG